jgi:repressor LexA
MKEDLLTKRQKEVFESLKGYIRDFGIAPSHLELAQLINVRSSKAAADHLKMLERKKMIEIYPDKPRGIRIIAQEHENELPLLGKVAAGQAIEALENIESYIAVPDILKRKHPSFFLRVSGDSMINAGILDGDLVAVKKSQTANVGDIVIARIDHAITIKRLHFIGKISVLHAANENYVPIKIPTNELIIEGVFVGLIRA